MPSNKENNHQNSKNFNFWPSQLSPTARKVANRGLLHGSTGTIQMVPSQQTKSVPKAQDGDCFALGNIQVLVDDYRNTRHRDGNAAGQGVGDAVQFGCVDAQQHV